MDPASDSRDSHDYRLAGAGVAAAADVADSVVARRTSPPCANTANSVADRREKGRLAGHGSHCGLGCRRRSGRLIVAA